MFLEFTGNYFRKEEKEKASTIVFLKKVTNEINYKILEKISSLICMPHVFMACNDSYNPMRNHRIKWGVGNKFVLRLI